MLTRREIIKRSTAATMAIAANHAFGADAAIPAPAAGYTGPIIDSHLHIWDLKTQRLPWLDHAGDTLNRSYSLADSNKATEGLNIVKAVYVEVAVDPSQRRAEAELAARVCQDANSRLAGAVIAGNPGADGFADYVKAWKDEKAIKGVRSSLQKGAADNKQFVAGLRLLGELGMSYDLLIGVESRGDAIRLAELCPDTQLILDHCGNTSLSWFAPNARAEDREQRALWSETIAKLAGRKNVSCKISGVTESAASKPVTAEMLAPIVNHCLETFGEDRVLFGSNWPVCLKTVTLREWHGLLTQIVSSRTLGAMKKLFHDNAEKVYKLKG